MEFKIKKNWETHKIDFNKLQNKFEHEKKAEHKKMLKEVNYMTSLLENQNRKLEKGYQNTVKSNGLKIDKFQKKILIEKKKILSLQNEIYSFQKNVKELKEENI